MRNLKLGSSFLKSISISLLIVMSLFLPRIVSAQVVINEFSPASNPSGYGDWIELYIFEDTNLSNYYLTHLKSDGSGDSSIEIPEPYDYGPSSANGKFKVISVNNYLGNDGDRIRLRNKSDGSIVDDISYGDEGGVCVSYSNGSIGRLFQNGIEGTNVIERFSNISKGLSNNSNVLDACPTPTQEPEDTPTPTPKPTNTPTIKPTAKPTPISTVVVPKVSPTEAGVAEKKEESENQPPVLGIQESKKEDKGENEPSGGDKRNNLKFIAPLVLILSGGGLIAASVYLFIRGKKQR